MAPMGVAADNQAARLAASLGELNAVEPTFSPALDVPYGGVLCALPALISLGLLESSEPLFTLPKGYYGLDSAIAPCIATSCIHALEPVAFDGLHGLGARGV